MDATALIRRKADSHAASMLEVSKALAFASHGDVSCRRSAISSIRDFIVPSGPVVRPPLEFAKATVILFDARQGGIEAVFTKPQRGVSIDAQPMEAPEGMTPPTAKPFLEAYDATGKLLGRAEYPLLHGVPG
jgi:hypothetical protein